MAPKKKQPEEPLDLTEDLEEIEPDDSEPVDLDEEELALDDDIVPAVDADEDVVFDADDDEYEDDEDEDAEVDEETEDALEELESEELQLLEDEVSEAMLIDEVEELRAMRRAELTLDVDAEARRPDEFVCQSCFMVKRKSQLANKRKMLCRDCAA
ncbi:MAG: DUF4193 family protein [Actinomycetes bacterium]|jgi:hypothetical protein